MSITDTNLYTALVTPMKENGDVHFDNLAQLIHRQDDAGNGVLILGSTGEGLNLSLEEKKEIVKTATSLNIDVPIMVGVGGYNLRRQIEWIEYCHEHDVDSYLLVTPLYAKPGPHGQVEWFKALLDASDKPCMLYNVPSRTGVKMSRLVLSELEDHPNFEAVKEASGSIEDFQNYAKTADGITFYSGDDGLMPFFAMAGCKGLVSVASNVWPKETSLYVERCLEGRGPELLPLWQECTDALFAGPNPVPVKVLLNDKGWIDNSTLHAPLAEEDVEDISLLKNADNIIQQWFEENS